MITPTDLTYEQFKSYCEAYIAQAWVDLCLENVCQWQLDAISALDADAQAWTSIRQYHPNIMIHVHQCACKTWDELSSYLQHELGHCLAFRYSQFYCTYAKDKEIEFNMADEDFCNRMEKIFGQCGLGGKWHAAGMANIKCHAENPDELKEVTSRVYARQNKERILKYVHKLKQAGMSEVEIYEHLYCSPVVGLS